MKKVTILAIAFIAVSLASCKKDYTCECTDDPGTSYAYTSKFTIHDTQSEADKLCKSYMPLWDSCKLD